VIHTSLTLFTQLTTKPLSVYNINFVCARSVTSSNSFPSLNFMALMCSTHVSPEQRQRHFWCSAWNQVAQKLKNISYSATDLSLLNKINKHINKNTNLGRLV
jgi:hypothetical protein